MELFGLVVPVWVLILGVYLVGMPAIGFPIGKYSLMAWKYPSQYPTTGKIMFPLNGTSNSIGELTYSCLDGADNLALTMDMFDVHKALQQSDALPIAKYLMVQMFCWPIRIVYTMILCTLIFVFSLPTYGAKLLSYCKKCVEI